MKTRRNICRRILLFLCVFGLFFAVACAKTQPETPPETPPADGVEKPYLLGESSVQYNNAPVSFSFVLNGYELRVSAENLTENDYTIENGVFTVCTDFFERENKKEYTFAYSLSCGTDRINGTLSVTSVAWGDVTWH